MIAWREMRGMSLYNFAWLWVSLDRDKAWKHLISTTQNTCWHQVVSHKLQQMGRLWPSHRAGPERDLACRSTPVLADDLAWIPSIHVVVHHLWNTTTVFSFLSGHWTHVVHRQICSQNTHANKIKINLKKTTQTPNFFHRGHMKIYWNNLSVNTGDLRLVSNLAGKKNVQSL